MNKRILSAELQLEDSETTIRPVSLAEYIGQEAAKESLEIFIKAAKRRKESLDHVLLYGPPGLGKTTLAGVISNEMATGFKVTSGPAIEKPGDIAAILNNLKSGDILFIDEIHRMPRFVEEVLYSAMEDFYIDILVGKGEMAKSIRLDLPKFTLIGATTKAGLLSSPLRDRFGIIQRLEYYTLDELTAIIMRTAAILNTPIEIVAAMEIAKCARGTPRLANRFLKRVRDIVEIKYDKLKIGDAECVMALELLGLDEYGLDELDRKILATIKNTFDGGPVGLSALAATLAEEVETLEDVYEPYLLQKGLIKRTRSGRMLTEAAERLIRSK
ncbi:Holliday junction branch migration DNA helicase RuvB [Candidatus Epulonipiscium viviparus]|uniref:Holliday junction branch migration DNA helicase RuvB n=1 Tax=Candidatus Epulonipiscium viviparus TaxID=420336 RepID=UPI0004969892|nr:Holliday junction branch migration DNA helicase RuvB [Candidatus Epulopiscium viviparus]